MNKICTSIEQSKKLIELGIDVNTADFMWEYNPDKETYWNKPTIIPIDDYIFVNDIPAWSLSALLELMPDKILINNESYYLSFNKNGVEFRGPITWDGQKSKSFEMDNILDAVFEMICWLKRNNKI